MAAEPARVGRRASGTAGCMSTQQAPSPNGPFVPNLTEPPPNTPVPRALGWASLGLGIPQVAMPGAFAQAIGVRPDREAQAWTLAVGIRELAAAAGILELGQPRPMGWLWARVAGDAMDLTLLLSALRSKPLHRTRVLAATGAVLAITAADVAAAMRMSSHPELHAEPGPVRARAAITVRRPRDQVYRFFRDFENLPSFMSHLDSVEDRGNGRSRWVARSPSGREVQWEAEIVEDFPHDRLSWRSREGSPVENSGTAWFVKAPGDRGTEIHLDLQYDLPGGALGVLMAELTGEDPRQLVRDDLRRAKQILETDTVVRSEGSPEGPMTRRLLRQRPAQPLVGSPS
jgi:uncharacterized membrane protein